MQLQQSAVDLGSWEISAHSVEEYLGAVGDTLPVYMDAGCAPSLMLAARVVGLLLTRLSLPDGAIHSLQDLETLASPRIGTRVHATAQLDPPRERGGMRFLTVNYTVSDEADGAPLVQGRTTVLLPAGEPADSQ